MAELPSGTVTLLFTDIEGSTRLWEQHPQAMPAALARHEAMLRQAIEAHGGAVFKTVGDALCAAFARAPAALTAALTAQRALVGERWGATGPLRVRIALHTGSVEVHAGDYSGLPLSRVARLIAAGHGGQVLLSRATHELVRDHLPPGVELRDLGEHRLKDLTRPEHIFQIVVPDLPADFPLLKTLDRHPTNLPVQPTPLIGREQEVAAAGALLQRPEVRLLTLTGPGGTGKTRLGLHVAAELLDIFADGVYVVPLAPIGDADLVISAIATTLGVQEAGGHPLFATLTIYLRDKQLLLLLDNFEQVVDAAPRVSELLAAASQLKVLVTSRAVLHLSAEHEYPVPPLGLPPRTTASETTARTELERATPISALSSASSVADLTHYAAVVLFIQRALAVKLDFAVTNENAPAIAEICYRLDGLPLAIELAAARAKLLSPHALLARLERRLPLLTGGPRDLPARQQTLRSTIDWSYNLLDADEQTLFRRLGVFVGGFTLEAAETVCTDQKLKIEDGGWKMDDRSASFYPPSSILDGAAALVDKSLLREEEVAGEPRFVMLETIREYALERLVASGEPAIMRQRHAHYFLALAEAAEPRLTTGEQRAWLERLDREHDNLRAALEWSRASSNAEVVLRLAGALGWFWFIRGHGTEGRRWLREALVMGSTTPAALRAKAYTAAGTLAFAQGDHDQAAAFHEQARALYQELGDQQGVAFALNNLGMQALERGDFARASTFFEESLALARRVDDRWLIASVLNNLGLMAREQGQRDRAVTYYQQGLARYREQGDQRSTALVLYNLGEALYDQGDYAGAAAHIEESLPLSRAHGDRLTMAATLQMLGKIAQAQGDLTRAGALYTESLTLFQEIGFKRGVAEGLERLASLACTMGAYGRAARLSGAAEALREASGTPLPPADRPAYERTVAAVRRQLGSATFTAVWAEGRALTPKQALETPEPPSPEHIAPAPQPPALAAPPPYPAGLTEREVEVLRLLARGLSYAEIAEQLVISPRTVNRHLTSIYTKLDVTSRHAAMRVAIEHHLV